MDINKSGLLFVMLVVFISIVGRVFYTDVVEPEMTEVKKGQVWEMHSDDPFNPQVYEYVILDVKEGWAKYCNIRYMGKEDIDKWSLTNRCATIVRIMELKGVYNNGVIDE